MCLLAEAKGEAGSMGMKGEACRGSLSHGKQLKRTKKTVNHIPSNIQASLRRMEQEFHLGKGVRTGAVGKMSDRGRRNEVERPWYTHAKEWHLFANNSADFREERLVVWGREVKGLGPS